ncbi:DNA cytosine methyltransferase [Acinetobacter colistiniresistens]|uniref:DNA cytosine methyltransferase n=1 Tax=Acinetobacter colistiniresistens TaxID=280145 RepID=UPI00124FCB11|nr:DNA cytosine methyltransferase [Acinetobacter colistiniresistens]
MTSFVDYSSQFKTQYALNFKQKIIVDFFAGGGGASTGLEMGLERTVYVAVNHNPKALSMHEANHPNTIHYVQDVFAVDPIEICDGYDVGWFHASPDCTHHSQAAGGQPRKKEIRDLSWVIPKFAGKKKPDVISLENVRQMLNWGPLIAKRDKDTGRVITLDRIEVNGKKQYRVADPGEIVPRDNQFLVPNPKKKGKTWRHFVRHLESLGYVVEWRLIRAADYGAPTTRERLFLVARSDGQPIVWADPTHVNKTKNKASKNQLGWRAAAEVIDFSDLGKSIFDRPKPLADTTLKRIAKGLKKYVIDAAEPFFVNSAAPYIGRDFRTCFGHDIREPLATTTAGYGGHSSLVSPILAPYLTEFANASQQRNWSAAEPLTTICAQVKGGHHALVAPVLVHAGHGEGTPEKPRWSDGCDSVRDPLGTITASGASRSLASAYLLKAQDGTDRTAYLSQETKEKALKVAAFFVNFYGNGDARDITAPLDTLTTKDRLALVTVWIKGDPWVIVDICIRMLKPRELYRGQGFPDSYIIDRGHDGKPLTKTEQVHMCGNSVSPYPMAAIARANNPFLEGVTA